ncbi:ATP-dependent protease ATPase subunit HslU [Candidatus Contubernalis alkaliaceticus]|uniref:ATP-dependent protease ATPase subunit HslU n=1 Tax=Candidatus Contubernalis alkaliaceticus TaxID=338645 RepID=UPI001F4BF12F|nr:ATP-dependent protease ATPase subunit HslU [Candidatus Contubernalis alkalaceticus]UNC91822.1 ATP-dependent protease ATPase subunit HslU [Candidatus Contubernalis alkalaceticus]
MEDLTPKQIVQELDKFIIGQENAKKSVAVALRNRFRRKKLPLEMRDEIIPKNIILIGPTGVGKTEIARRLARLVNAPFVKVEATKFTEVGYVGRDVETMVRDLVETAIRIVKSEKMASVEDKARQMAEERLVKILLPLPKKEKSFANPLGALFQNFSGEEADDEQKTEDEDQKHEEIFTKRNRLGQELKEGKLEEQYVEIEVEDISSPMVEIFSGHGVEEMGINFQDILGNMMPKKKKKRKVTVSQARKILIQEEAQRLIDMDQVTNEAIMRAEQSGIIFLDEIDKISGKDSSVGPDVSREGVQRDILPIVEGSTVMTKYGPVKTDFVLFIAAGAFHIAKPSDLIPELQGRFPIRVELNSLTKNDFKQILIKPENAIIKQYIALLSTEGINIIFKEEAIEEIAELAYNLNEQMENIGARRLQTILEKLLEEVSFEAPDMIEKEVVIDAHYVQESLKDIVQNRDLSKYIL